MDTLVVVFSKEQIKSRVEALGAEITKIYNGEPIVMICVLKGAVIFFSDLARQIDCPMELDFVRISSYGNAASSSKNLAFLKDIEVNIDGKHVLIVEDIIDTGHTMEFLLHQMEARGAKSIRVAALINKSERREKAIDVDFIGFNLGSGFIVGYGLDYAEKYRELPDIYEVRLSNFNSEQPKT